MRLMTSKPPNTIPQVFKILIDFASVDAFRDILVVLAEFGKFTFVATDALPSVCIVSVW